MKSFIVIVLLVLCVGCNNKPIAEVKPPLPENIFNSYHNAVVVIKNEYLYKISIVGGKTYYLSTITDDSIGILWQDFDSAYNTRNIVYGTGFFIDKYGMIATNRHVVDGEIGLETVRNRIKTKFSRIFSAYADEIKRLDDTLNIFENTDQAQMEDSEINHIKYWKAERYFDEAMMENVEDIALNDINVSVINSTLLAASDSLYNSSGKIIKCEKVKVSQDENIDLALIQTVDHLLPDNTKYIPLDTQNNSFFTLHDSIVNNPLRINTKLYMIGYNRAGAIGLTSNGLRPQLTQGTVSQESDKALVLYSIPSLPGSSGSPIFDEWGNIVAVNFAGISSSQSFNYGILVRHLKSLYDK